MKIRKILFYVFIIIASAINVWIIVESATGGGASSERSHGFSQIIYNIIYNINPQSSLIKDMDTFHAWIRKLFGHFLFFGASGFFTTLSFEMIADEKLQLKRFVLINSLLIGLVLATISECIQLFTPGRAGAVTDILIDFSGYLLFTIIIFFIFILINKGRSTKRNK